jgi:type I restriction enzyme S subunit
MAGEWRGFPFSAAVTVNPRVELMRGNEYPFVDMQAVNAGSRCAYAGEMRIFEGGGSRFAVGDTLMARITPCLENGKIARFCACNQEMVAHGSTEFIVIRGREGITDNDYAYYLTKWDGVSGYAVSQMTGTSGRQRVPTESLDHLNVPIPPLAEQRAIAHILGTLDNKIELNRRMNETLEGIARPLFKSWFVDFDPVRAKAEGRDPDLPKPIADLFPDSFEESELGEIPRGWAVDSFAATVEIIGGGTPKTNIPEYWDGEIPWFSVVDAPKESDIWVVETEKKITQAGVENSSTRVLPEGSTIISARGTVGKIALVGVPMAMNQSCYGLCGKVNRHGSLTYFATRHLVSSLRRHAHGSVFDTITRDTLAGVEVVVPPSSIGEAFEQVVRPTLERIRVNLFECCALVALRDTLLPKLISGELRVKDAKRFSDRRMGASVRAQRPGRKRNP